MYTYTERHAFPGSYISLESTAHQSSHLPWEVHLQIQSITVLPHHSVCSQIIRICPHSAHGMPVKYFPAVPEVEIELEVTMT